MDLRRLLVAAALATVPARAGGQLAPDPATMTNSGVVRASAAVDSVFLLHARATDTVPAGDWAAYLMARLGVRPIPADLRLRVVNDSGGIRITGRIADLPAPALSELGVLLAVLDTNTRVDAWASLTGAGPTAVRFRLDSAALGGIGIPEAALTPVLANVGRRYPVLTPTGRDLLVAVPRGGRVELVSGGVRLVAPPPPPAAPTPRKSGRSQAR